jgi:hypothetical protein
MRPLVKKSRNVGHTNSEAHSRPRGLLTGCKMSDVPADGPLLIRCNRPPKADIGRRDRHVRLVPKADIRNAADLFDHLVGELLKLRRHMDAERLRSLEVDD